MISHAISRRNVLSMLAAGAVLPPAVLRAAAGDGAIVVPIALTGSRLVVAVTIGTSAPMRFAVDTGALVGLLRDNLLDALKLPFLRNLTLGGAGGKRRVALHRATNVVIGGALRQPELEFAVADLPRLGPGISGTIGSELFAMTDSVFDFGRGEWRLYPDAPPDRTGFTRIPSEIRRGEYDRGSPYLFADAVLDGRNYRLLVDTGAPGQVKLHSAATIRSGLWSGDRPFAPMRPSGIGGQGAVGRLVRAGSLDFGGVRFERPIVQLVPLLGDSGLADGIIGLPLIRRLNLASDTKTRSLWAQPSGLATEPDRVPGSGLWLDRDGNVAEVRAVGRGSPAEAAGMAAGDKIVGVPFGALIGQISGAPGERVTLQVERGGQRRTVTLTLADYL